MTPRGGCRVSTSGRTPSRQRARFAGPRFGEHARPRCDRGVQCLPSPRAAVADFVFTPLLRNRSRKLTAVRPDHRSDSGAVVSAEDSSDRHIARSHELVRPASMEPARRRRRVPALAFARCERPMLSGARLVRTTLRRPRGGELARALRQERASAHQHVRAPARETTQVPERSRARTARSVVGWPHGSACDEGPYRGARPRRLWQLRRRAGAGLRTLSRGAVVDNGDTSRRPNLSLLVASVSTQSSRLTASIPPDPTAVGSPRPVPH